ncbi:MAG: Ferredoxin 3 fused to uncharacterized domain [Candidatus Ozemobacter sibiricus]|jgi:Pyruvate/2-oxoacid:ferredoxin oxidoreductase delta subunit|uniref:Ferredoxin 3 fused to uncharacterized domain n=1 Tax=Candidatus Ozemobacter sibiricus TaxID=2268124 RepID=A0A367ZN17_9BACT|nr:MAG: Ferredoxin 3 fused to uncharacterized domain [Candidatus Ozemobacter sibiricus]
MKRKIIEIDEEKCNGCGLCVPGCQEGALQIIDGKARLVSDVYCDGLGACLGQCPQGALKVVEREAPEFDAQAVENHLRSLGRPTPAGHGSPSGAVSAPSGSASDQGHVHAGHHHHHHHGHGPGGGCPGSVLRRLTPAPTNATITTAAAATGGEGVADVPPPSQLGHWPVQLMLVPPHAPFLQNADLVLCADCVPFAIPDFHARYLQGRSILVGCPKLDDAAFYQQKLTAIFQQARPRRVTVLRMEVPCCGGLTQLAQQARAQAGVDVPLEVHVIGIQGGIVSHQSAT